MTDRKLPQGTLFFIIRAMTPETISAIVARLELDFTPIVKSSPVFPARDGHNMSYRLISTQLPVYLHEMSQIRHFIDKLETFFNLETSEPVTIIPGYALANKAVIVMNHDKPYRIHLGKNAYAQSLAIVDQNGVEWAEWGGEELRYEEVNNFLLQITQDLKDKAAIQ